MKSKTVVTFEIDDIPAAVEELCDKLKDSFELGKNSIGLFHCYSDMDAPDMCRELYAKLGIPILGGTAVAYMDSTEGFHQMTSTLTVLTADDCSFSAALSDPLTPEGVDKCAESCFKKISDELGEEPKLLYLLPAYTLDIMLDAYTDAFDECAQGIPLVGGIPSNNGNGDEVFLFYNGEAYTDRMAVLGISGNIKPVFNCCGVIFGSEVKKGRVTKAEANVVYTVDNKPFVDYLVDLGILKNNSGILNKTISFVANPIVVEETDGIQGRGGKYIRAIHDVNYTDGSAIAIGRVPEHSYISIHPMNRDEITETALSAMGSLKEQMKQMSADGYVYSTVLAVSCMGRYVIMSPKRGVEAEALLSELPEGLNMSGFYSYGEICPQISPNGETTNFSHNETLVLCAF